MAGKLNYFDYLEAAVTIAHECRSVHRATVFVHERTDYGLTIWKGDVEVFDLEEHPTARTCYTWIVYQGNHSEIFTVLESKIVDSAQKAVRAMICLDQLPVKLIPPLANGLERLKRQVDEAKRIVHTTEIKSEDLVAAIDASAQNYREIMQRFSGRLFTGG